MAYYKKIDKRRIYKDPSYASCPANMYYRESEKENNAVLYFEITGDIRKNPCFENGQR